MNATPNTYRASCVCNYTGHCWACLEHGVRCTRDNCRATRSDGIACASLVKPPPPAAPARRPAPPRAQAVLAEDPRVCTTAAGLETALRDSLALRCPAAAHALGRDLSVDYVPGKWRMQLVEVRERVAMLASADLDPHERRRASVTQKRAAAPRIVSSQRARGVA